MLLDAYLSLHVDSVDSSVQLYPGQVGDGAACPALLNGLLHQNHSWTVRQDRTRHEAAFLSVSQC